MDTVSLCVPSKLIRDFYIFSVSKALRPNPSARSSTVANNIHQFMDVFSTKTISLDDLLCYAVYLTIVLFFNIFNVRCVFTPVLLRNWPF
jgi:hypothetical protein